MIRIILGYEFCFAALLTGRVLSRSLYFMRRPFDVAAPHFGHTGRGRSLASDATYPHLAHSYQVNWSLISAILQEYLRQAA